MPSNRFLSNCLSLLLNVDLAIQCSARRLRRQVFLSCDDAVNLDADALMGPKIAEIAAGLV